jgi:hypothetical protein
MVRWLMVRWRQVEFIELVQFIETVRDSWRLLEIQWRFIRNPNAKAQMANKVPMPKAK